MASNDLVTNCTLILSTKLTKGDVSYPRKFGAGVLSVSYDGTGFAAFIVVRDGRHYDSVYSVAACESPIFVDLGWWSVVVAVSACAPSLLPNRSTILTSGSSVGFLVGCISGYLGDFLEDCVGIR